MFEFCDYSGKGKTRNAGPHWPGVSRVWREYKVLTRCLAAQKSITGCCTSKKITARINTSIGITGTGQVVNPNDTIRTNSQSLNPAQ